MTSRSVHLTLLLALNDLLPLVVQMTALSEGDLDLCDTTNEVDLQRNKRETLLVHLAGEAIDFPPMQQQLSLPFRGVSTADRERVRSDVGVLQPEFPVLDQAVGVFELHLTGAEALHLGPREDDASLIRVEDVVVVACAPVGCDDFVTFSHDAKTRSVSGDAVARIC